MYGGPWHTLPHCRFLDWPVGGRETSLAGVAARLVETAGISDGATLVGSSLGGMVACEIARLRRLECIYLIGSARRKQEMNLFLRLFHPLARIAPIAALQRLSGRFPGELSAMFSRSDPRFVRNMCMAIFAWEGLPDGITDVRRIHGKRDLMIPPPDDVDLLLDGGHMLAMTHAAECVQFISARADRPASRPGFPSTRIV